MIPSRSSTLWGVTASVVGALAAVAGTSDTTPFSCSAFSAHGRIYSLQLPEAGGGWPLHVSHALSTPPTTTELRVGLDLCSPLAYDDRRPAADQCPEGTLTCLSIINLREGDDDRLLQVVPIATVDGPVADDDTSIALRWTATPLDAPDPSESDGSDAPASSDNGLTLRLTIKGQEYAHVHHKLVLDLECDHGAAAHAAPRWTSYDPLHGELRLHWRSPRACPHPRGSDETEKPTPGHDDDGDRRDRDDRSSDPVTAPASPRKWGFFSVFFLVIGIVFALYFVLGMWYNSRTYGSAEIPHRDFWREAPYLARDLLKQAAGVVGAGAGALGQNMGVDARFWGPKRWSSATSRPRGTQDGYEPV